MIFASDNWTGASDRVAAALVEAAGARAPAYGNDPLTASVEAAFARVFERDVAVFFVATGTAANALALAQFGRPGGVVFCHRDAHIAVDEGGAPEFFGNGARLHRIDGADGKLHPADLAAAIALYPAEAVHHGQPVAVSISQLTEAGTAYEPTEIAALAAVAHGAGLPLHMDGARFGNAVAGLGVSPAEASWRAGVDVLSFGGSKNGCFAAEAVIFFDKAQARGFEFHRKRAGHLFSKSGFVSAQFSAYLADGHWLELAAHANAMASRLAAGITATPGASLAFEPDGNELFVVIPRELDARLRAAGAVYYEWSPEGLVERDRRGEFVAIRLVTSFRTRVEEVENFVRIISAVDA
ncbi:L-threonine aldolase [Kaistia sp. 32K]|uniref:threonine aldolase family protein n=1 Tax=Kaistia sp. 32K TaxID=2795690 RepID=UPI001916491A|nr:low specificity L-threonine aldolase [Kaistia sp. 32K]BCP55016.1 L-threonine aldolase [Kaistia sp. 32K]